MGKFKIGNKALALKNPPNDSNQPRVKGKIYIVNAISFCMGCGDERINIGIKSDTLEDGSYKKIRCHCKSTQPSNGLMWTNSKYFAKIDEDGLEAVEKEAVEKEDYELAGIIRDLKIDI